MLRRPGRFWNMQFTRFTIITLAVLASKSFTGCFLSSYFSFHCYTTPCYGSNFRHQFCILAVVLRLLPLSCLCVSESCQCFYIFEPLLQNEEKLRLTYYPLFYALGLDNYLQLSLIYVSEMILNRSAIGEDIILPNNGTAIQEKLNNWLISLNESSWSIS